MRVVANLAHKTQAQRQHAAQTPNPVEFNPFLPYENALYVGELSTRYRCLLNKFNVMAHHILMVTTAHAQQREPLDSEDFFAAALCLLAQDGLVFYNGGTEAGASVQHKHLQMIPLPLSAVLSFPLAELFSGLPSDNGEVYSAPIPFSHRIAPAAYTETGAMQIAKTNLQRYRQLMNALQLMPQYNGLMPPHNMLLTREFLWVIPRTLESYRGLAVNALGYAGTLLVKNETQLQQLDKIGCLKLLTAVSQ